MPKYVWRLVDPSCVLIGMRNETHQKDWCTWCHAEIEVKLASRGLNSHDSNLSQRKSRPCRMEDLLESNAASETGCWEGVGNIGGGVCVFFRLCHHTHRYAISQETLCWHVSTPSIIRQGHTLYEPRRNWSTCRDSASSAELKARLLPEIVLNRLRSSPILVTWSSRGYIHSAMCNDQILIDSLRNAYRVSDSIYTLYRCL